MKLIICLDDKNGLSFADRRQSRDKIQLKRMLEVVGDSKLFISDYSASLFETVPVNVIVCACPLEDAGKDDYCFLECEIPYDNSLEEIIIYRWNRVYPSDQRFDLSLLEGRTLCSVYEFSGNSHEKITEEVYR